MLRILKEAGKFPHVSDEPVSADRPNAAIWDFLPNEPQQPPRRSRHPSSLNGPENVVSGAKACLQMQNPTQTSQIQPFVGGRRISHDLILTRTPECSLKKAPLSVVTFPSPPASARRQSPAVLLKRLQQMVVIFSRCSPSRGTVPGRRPAAARSERPHFTDPLFSAADGRALMRVGEARAF